MSNSNIQRPDPDAVAGRTRDGEVTINLSEDELTVFADFSPPIGNGNPLSLENIENFLNAQGITYGVDWDAIREVLFQCNTNRKTVKQAIIARGTPPRKAVPNYIKLKERLFQQKPLLDPHSPHIDFKEVSPFIIVKKGESIGREVEATPGESGITVKNEKITPGTQEVIKFALGENVRQREDGTIAAAVEGRFEKKQNVISIEEVLDVEGGVDYHTGHIIFPGDVIIKGEVKDGFKVYSGGSIICKDILDAYDVVSKKDLIVASGIVGKNKGVLRVAGDIKAKFLENCLVKSKGSLYIQDEILNCRVYTLNHVSMGDKGKIIGGEMWAVQGISAYQIGNEPGQCPQLQCGIDFLAQKRLDQVKKKHTALYLKLQTLETLQKKRDSEELTRLAGKLKEGMKKLEEQMNRLLERVHRNEDAEIVVIDTIYPGTTIEICNFHYIIDSPMRNVRFRLNKEQGKIINEKLK